MARALSSDLVHEQSVSSGTGNLTLTNVSGKRSFNTAFGTGSTTDVFYYFISNRAASEWEIGTGHLSASSTLVRDTVLSSSNANALVNFSTDVKDITSDYPYSIQSANREVLTANRTYYVRTDGSDSNSGLANTSGGAYLTIQKAINTVARLDLSIYDVTIQIATGTYTGANTLKTLVGAGLVTIQGDDTTPSNVVISTTSATGITGDGIRGRWRVSGIKFQSTTSGIHLSLNGPTTTLLVGKVDFGSAAGGASPHIFVQNGAYLEVDQNYTISGSASYHWDLINGTLQVGTVTITLTGTPAFGTTFILATRLAYARINAVTFSGSATGVRYDASANGVIFTNAGGASFVPGNSAGSTSTGGQYI